MHEIRNSGETTWRRMDENSVENGGKPLKRESNRGTVQQRKRKLTQACDFARNIEVFVHRQRHGMDDGAVLPWWWLVVEVVVAPILTRCDHTRASAVSRVLLCQVLWEVLSTNGYLPRGVQNTDTRLVLSSCTLTTQTFQCWVHVLGHCPQRCIDQLVILLLPHDTTYCFHISGTFPSPTYAGVGPGRDNEQKKGDQRLAYS